MLADKDYRAVIDIISPFAAGFVCLTPDSPRALPAEQLAAELRDRGFYARPCGTAEEGIEAALSLAAELGGKENGKESHQMPAEENMEVPPVKAGAASDGQALPVVAFGSLYMAGAVRSAFRGIAAL
jgi:dihydrofolate synthase/folylpolyglutamate synthase